MQRFIVYTRVSTKRQGDSGLGLEAQQRDIQIYFENYVQEPFEVVAEFSDVESGTRADRAELTKAIELAKETGATLLVAKLDRLSRSVAFIATLMEDKKIDFKVASMPMADKVMLHIYAVISEAERDFISKRTKAALAQAKARGVKLGGARPEAEKRHEAVRAMADQNALRVSKFITNYRKAGKSYRCIAEHLNELSVPTARGTRWYGGTVQRYDLRLAS